MGNPVASSIEKYSANSPRPEAKRIAIVTVHGVGDQEPGGTVRAIGDLLLNFVPGSYESFTESKIRIPVQKVEVLANRPRDDKALGIFDQRAPSLRARQRGQAAALEQAHSVGYDYMADQLAGYEPNGDDRVYNSIRLEGARRGPPNQPACEAHLFEIYWSDLARLRTGIFGVFDGIVEVYQILFQLCILGRHNLDFALAQEPGSMEWRVFKFCGLQNGF